MSKRTTAVTLALAGALAIAGLASGCTTVHGTGKATATPQATELANHNVNLKVTLPVTTITAAAGVLTLHFNSAKQVVTATATETNPNAGVNFVLECKGAAAPQFITPDGQPVLLGACELTDVAYSDGNTAAGSTNWILKY